MTAGHAAAMVNHLRERRKRAGLTQQELAHLADVSRSTVRMLEAGYEPQRSMVLARIERALTEHEGRRAEEQAA